jgi:ribosomal protein S18 acetylase RimI-like enzyme
MHDQPCRLLTWDSEFFGFPIASVLLERLDDAAIAAIDSWCEARDVRCLYYECNAADQDSIRRAGRGGFEVVDVRLLFTGRSHAMAADGPAALRDATEADVPALRAIAAQSHRDSRFFADPRFSAERAAELFATWIANAVAGHADRVLVADRDGEVAGYSALRRQPGGRGRIDLFAVAPPHRRQGIGRQLIRSSCAWLAAQGVPTVFAATQARNASAQRAYQRCGLALGGVWLYYHKWYPPQ